jgi:hypothetical protein
VLRHIWWSLSGLSPAAPATHLTRHTTAQDTNATAATLRFSVLFNEGPEHPLVRGELRVLGLSVFTTSSDHHSSLSTLHTLIPSSDGPCTLCSTPSTRVSCWPSQPYVCKSHHSSPHTPLTLTRETCFLLHRASRERTLRGLSHISNLSQANDLPVLPLYYLCCVLDW